MTRDGSGGPSSRELMELHVGALYTHDAPIKRTWAGPAYGFLDVPRPLLPAWAPDVEHAPPLLALVAEGCAVAVCGSVRITPRAHEAGVATVLAFHGHGYAPRVVAGWARAVRALGDESLCRTSWDNVVVRAVARTLGPVAFGSDLHLA